MVKSWVWCIQIQPETPRPQGKMPKLIRLSCQLQTHKSVCQLQMMLWNALVAQSKSMHDYKMCCQEGS